MIVRSRVPMCLVAVGTLSISIAGQRREPEPAAPLYVLEDSYLRWPLSPGDEAYGTIDGKRLKQYVVDQSNISRRYRDAGHQLWGRIIGTSADLEDAAWVEDRLRRLGITEVRRETFDLQPQWLPSSWEVAATDGSKSITLTSAQPVYQTPATPPEGLDIEAVWVGAGTEADFIGRNVKGKAAFIFSAPIPGARSHTAVVDGGMLRAEQHGAAVVVAVVQLPGNMRLQFYPTGNKVPSFALGRDDGDAIRQLIEAQAGRAPHVKVRLDIDMVPNLKTASIWATIPGTTDEHIVVLAHRDGWFDAGMDNASGVATAFGIAEYYAKLPREKRRRTLNVVFTPGHHHGGGNQGGESLAKNSRAMLAKTALIINCEHTASTQAYLLGPHIRLANMPSAFWWYISGSPTLEKIAIETYRRFGIATFDRPETRGAGEVSPIYQMAPSLQLIQSNIFFHSDAETPDVIPPVGLEATARAYSRIIDEVNKHTIGELVRSGVTP
jgi:Peptidase family M28